MAVDCLPFNQSLTNFYIQYGTIEKWLINNPTAEDHFFHIHQIAFQVLKVGNQTVPFTGYQDTVQLPRSSNVTVALPFNSRPLIKGNFVTHCHITGHEDLGMMAQILLGDELVCKDQAHILPVAGDTIRHHDLRRAN